MKCFVTGGAGFIGSHLVDRLLAEGNSVVVYDSFSLGRKKLIEHNFSNPKFSFVRADLLDAGKLAKEMKGSDIVFHLAANSDIIQSAKKTNIDLEQGTIATYNVLEAMRSSNIKKIVFSSSNVVYGEAKKMPTTENYGPCLPISMYGASKLACEGLITAFCHNFGFKAWIYRFVNIIGQRSTHGVVLDFYRKLQKNPGVLEVLGDGKQSKPYLEVKDCVDGMLFGLKHAHNQVNLFNLGTAGVTSVSTIARLVIDELNLNAKIKYTGGSRGWPGDVSTVSIDVSKIKALGWTPKHDSSDEAVRVGIADILKELQEIS